MSGINDPLRGRIADRWQALMGAIDGVPETRQEEPGAAGGWSVKDVLGHIAFWDADATARVRSLIAGQDARAVEEYEEANQREAARRSAWSLADVRAELDHTHAALLASLDAADAAGVAIDPPVIEGATAEHYDEHLPDLVAFRDRVSD
ncbi:MAG TPA: maleylpyruvate isomerase N-terminal domain-containing protein [Thermomicrobiaceae bacterium]|nr:maleylpyruvate isomerase N-terminal domain-containing protein [Thermomicrobiaceae bacterium]